MNQDFYSGRDLSGEYSEVPKPISIGQKQNIAIIESHKILYLALQYNYYL
jgi:hypothetical protein